MNKLPFIIVGIIGLFCVSCLETEISLESKDYAFVDSIYTLKKDSLDPILQDRCMEYRDSVLPVWIDSIRAKREAEIERLIGR